VLEFTTDLVIVAPPTKVLDAFFDNKALAAWWQAKQAVCVPRPLGSIQNEPPPVVTADPPVGAPGEEVGGYPICCQPTPAQVAETRRPFG